MTDFPPSPTPDPSPDKADEASQGYGPGYAPSAPTPIPAPAAGEGTSQKARAIGWMFKASLTMTALLLVGAVALAVIVESSAGEDWTGFGILIALVFSVFTLVCFGLAWAGTKVRHRSPNAGLVLTILGLGGTCLLFMNACSAGLGGF
jgi:hypothetical protein